MGESAKILNPEKTVLMPSLTADCAMAHMASLERIAELRAEYDDLAVVCYINSTAELKCASDVCVTSSNAVRIVRALPNKNVFFIPDRNLGRYVAELVPEKNIILNDGCCPIHAAISLASVVAQKTEHPFAPVLSHPECNDDILSISDYVGSTADIISYVKNSDKNEFIVCTEDGVAYELRSVAPEKSFYFPRGKVCCADMKLNTLESIRDVLKNGNNEILLSQSVIDGALAPLDRMFELAK